MVQSGTVFGNLKYSARSSIIVLKAWWRRILAHTHGVGIRTNGGAAGEKVVALGGRNGVAVCWRWLGWSGYINRITLEIYNLNKHERSSAPVGESEQWLHCITLWVDGGYGRGEWRRQISTYWRFGWIDKNSVQEMVLPRASRIVDINRWKFPRSKRGVLWWWQVQCSVGGRKRTIRIIRKVIDLKVATSVNW